MAFAILSFTDSQSEKQHKQQAITPSKDDNHMVEQGQDNSRHDFPLLDFIDQGIQSRNENYISVMDSHAERRKSILSCILDAGSHGITVDEISERLGVPPNAVSGRVSELKKAGLCRHTEIRRRTRSGYSAAVIVAVGGVR